MKLGGLFPQRDAPYEELKRSRKTWGRMQQRLLLYNNRIKETLGFFDHISLHFAFPFYYSNYIMAKAIKDVPRFINQLLLFNY